MFNSCLRVSCCLKRCLVGMGVSPGPQPRAMGVSPGPQPRDFSPGNPEPHPRFPNSNLQILEDAFQQQNFAETCKNTTSNAKTTKNQTKNNDIQGCTLAGRATAFPRTCIHAYAVRRRLEIRTNRKLSDGLD